MTSNYLITVFLLSLACFSANASAPQFVLTEDDYRGVEGGVLNAAVFRAGGFTMEDVVINIKTLTAQQAIDTGYQLPAAFDNYDPAEQNDFTVLDMNFTFSSSESSYIIEIPLTADEINEPLEEAFLILLTVVEASEEDSALIGATDIAIGLIQDDDDIKLSFTTDKMTVSEDVQSFELTIEKEGGRLTEQTLTVNVAAFTHDAILNLDFRFPNSAEQNVLTFLPNEQRKQVTVVILEDGVLGEVEHFTVDLVVAEGAKYSIGRIDRVIVIIQDNDEPPTTTESPTTPTPGSQQDCPDVGVAIGITFLLTFLLTALLALLIVILVVICDRKHRRKCDVQQHVSSTDSLASQSTQQLP